MANMKAMYVPSTTPGKHWKIVAFKASKGGMVNATEGVLESSGGFTSFTFIMFEARRISGGVGRMTSKNIVKAWKALMSEMVEKGLVEQDEVDKLLIHIV